jgi:uncharacterized protein YidB (DUF937 family)
LQTQGEGQHGALMEVVLGLVNNPQTGGLAGLVQKFQAGGLGDVVASWISTGQNLPVSADQIVNVLGDGRIQEIARTLGIEPDAVSGHLAQVLPQVVDKLTPNGTLPEAGGLGGLLGALAGKS